uniref:C2H2-type domain-containing protein n=1 Tax=Timema shepardi TaxID=629360 RepID=A0A7R9AW33_TIMSH|nr:unnamed protein product [Timema shepardi]
MARGSTFPGLRSHLSRREALEQDESEYCTEPEYYTLESSWQTSKAFLSGHIIDDDHNRKEGGKCFSRKNKFKNHHLTHAGLRQHVCKECSQCFIHKKTLIQHSIVHNTQQKYKCEICDKCFVLKCYLTKHVRSHAAPKQHTCETCGKGFITKSELRKHVLSHAASKEHKCETCGKVFITKSELKKHVLSHVASKEHKCETCDKCFIKKSYLSEHVLTHMPLKEHTCEICDKGFINKSGLRKHFFIHTALKEHRCEICDKGFINKSGLRKHFFIHTALKEHICEICGKGFINKTGLRKHVFTHTSLKELECEICGMCFRHNYHLTRHILTHTALKEHKCETCGKCFIKKSYLSEHVLIHTSLKEHRCETCGKGFITNSRLRKHVSTHTSLKEHTCETCGKGFIDKSGLRKHGYAKRKREKTQTGANPGNKANSATTTPSLRITATASLSLFTGHVYPPSHVTPPTVANKTALTLLHGRRLLLTQLQTILPATTNTPGHDNKLRDTEAAPTHDFTSNANTPTHLVFCYLGGYFPIYWCQSGWEFSTRWNKFDLADPKRTLTQLQSGTAPSEHNTWQGRIAFIIRPKGRERGKSLYTLGLERRESRTTLAIVELLATSSTLEAIKCGELGPVESSLPTTIFAMYLPQRPLFLWDLLQRLLWVLYRSYNLNKERELSWSEITFLNQWFVVIVHLSKSELDASKLEDDPFSFEDVDRLDNSLQTEFLDLKYDCEAKIIFKQSGHELVWVKLMDTYPQLWGKTEPLLISFPSTYLVEKGFSSVVQILPKQRNKLDICLKGDLRLNLTNIKPDIQALTEIHQA